MGRPFVRLINTLPVPLFGSARTATAWTMSKAKLAPRFAGWAVPLGVGALWFVWPAVDDGWKIEMGFKADPEATATETVVAPKVELSPAALLQIETAYVASEAVETEDDKMLKTAMSTGDYSAFETKWEAFTVKSIKPGEDDDDDDDDDAEARMMKMRTTMRTSELNIN